MKQLIHKLSDWWFATMVPVHGPLTTIDARETLRKRRLFSVIFLIGFVGVSLFVLQGIFTSAPAIQQSINVGATSISLLILWINRRGHLKIASVLYFLVLFLGMVTQISALSFNQPILSLCLWAMLLLLPVCAGLFLPAWGPLLLVLFETGFMIWFVLSERRSQIALYMKSPGVQLQFLFFTCTLISVIGIFSAIYAITTKRAVIQADRAVELEQAHTEISEAYSALGATHIELETAHRELETAHVLIQKQALTDGLTGLPNHRAIVDQLNKELDRVQRYAHPFSVLFFDGDRFKRVNDTYGHAAGDAVLRQIGERAGSVLRGGDILGRFGGEEFVVLLPEADESEARIVAERIRAAVAASPLAIEETEGGVATTVSIGLSSYPTDGTSEHDLLSQADGAMYIAKRLGRNQVRTAEEARHMSTDVELMALLQQEEQREAVEREGATPEHLREKYTLRTIYSLVSLLERRDEGLNAHTHVVSEMAIAIASAMRLEEQDITRIGMAALLHDIGKVAVPDALLQKLRPLSSQEQVRLQEHAELGAQILEVSPLLHDLMPGVRHHHEHWDGSGYPDQLTGDNIPLAARIIAVAEAYDAMQREYPYQISRTPEEAIAELQRCAGTQFDAEVVAVFTTLLADQQQLQSSLQLVG